jgi:AcrR family transcriptional regulator
MIKGTPELIAERREEIMNACETLYDMMPFREVTLKEIGKLTTCSRPTIYNYFQTKEEIFLALFEREYVLWTEELLRIGETTSGMSKEMLAECIAESLEKRKLLLKLLAVNLYDMEENSRLECLVCFKVAYGKSREALFSLLRSVYPHLPENRITDIVFTFLPYLHGVYPYAFATEKQIAAMDEAKINHPSFTIHELVKTGLLKLLP